ncbi:tyrosine-type recombinase/integrase [candidate division KSB1 bacterium]|nr:tyrosine-type recombinase/integrase [candidate division KSB1 bacterium]
MPHDANRDKIKYHTQEDLDRFFAKLYNLSPPRDYALFSLMYYFGLRASEIGLIGLDYLDLKRNRIWVTRLKGGVSAEYPLPRSTRLLRRLKTYLNSRGLSDRDVLFLSRLKQPYFEKTD